MAESKSIWYKIQNINYRYLIAFLMIWALLWAFYPQAFPTTISANTMDFYNYVENIPKGSVFMFDFSGVVTTPSAVDMQTLPMIAHLFLRGGDIKVIAFSITTTGPPMWELLMNEVPASIKAKVKYGVDYVYMGFIPGDESGLVAFMSNMRGVLTKDYYGNRLDDLPLMKSGNPKTGGPINDGSAISVMMPNPSSEAMFPEYIRVFGDLWHIPIIRPLAAMNISTSLPYVPTYITHWFQMEKMVEYEFLLNKEYGYTGYNMTYYALRAYVSLFMTSLVIITNIAIVAEKYGGKQKLAEVKPR